MLIDGTALLPRCTKDNMLNSLLDVQRPASRFPATCDQIRLCLDAEFGP